jgi:hypothetical protein
LREGFGDDGHHRFGAMRKFIAIFGLLFATALLAPLADAQFTIVTGTVTDPNGLAWACGTISASLVNNSGVSPTLNGVSFSGFTSPVKLGCPTDPTSSSTAGAFTMQLADNTVIKCGISVCSPQTTWQFTVNIAPGILPPEGTGPQSFSQIFTISGSTQTLTFFNVPALLRASGGGNNGTISPLGFGAKADVRFLYDCTFNATTTVTCPNESPFTPADVGKIEFGTQGNVSVTPPPDGTLECPQGTITGFVNSSTITVTPACTLSCTPSASQICAFAWGTQDDATAINAAVTAAWNTAGVCKALQLPAAYMFIGSAVLGGPVGNSCGAGSSGAGADLNSQGPMVFGAGPGVSVLVPLPSFNFAGCTNGSGSTCIGGAANAHMHDFAVNGLQQSLPSTTHNNILFESLGGLLNCPGGIAVWNVGLAGWALQSTGTIGFQFGQNACNDPAVWNVNVSKFGQQLCKAIPAGGNTLTASALMCFGGAGGVPILAVAGSDPASIFNSFGGQYLGSMASNGATVKVTAGVFNSFGDTIKGEFAGTSSCGGCQIISTGGATQAVSMNFIGDTISMQPTTPSGTNTLFFLQDTAASSVRVRDSVLTAAGTNNQFLNSTAGNAFFDDGGNTFANGGLANSIGGAVFGSLSATGNVFAIGNVGLTSGWGTSTVSSAAGDSHRMKFTVNVTGTPAASPVITVTFPTVYPILAPASCSISQVAGNFGVVTNPSFGAPTTTQVAITFSGTPVATNSYTFDLSCGP